MILFLITQELEYLGSELNVLHRNYIVWNCRLTDFIKREYISIDTMKPEAIVIEQVALENSKDLIEFQNSFPEIKIILIVRDKSELLDLQGIEIVDQNENILESLRKILKISEKPKIDVQKQEMQIGFLSQDRETAVLAAINFVKTLSESEKNLCFCEITTNVKKAILPKLSSNYGLIGENGIYKWNDISFLCNSGKDGVAYTICSFCEEDPIEKMFEHCNIQIWCESDDGESILHYENRHIRINIDNPFENDYTKDFRELLGSQNTILDTENTKIEEECIVEQNSKIVSEIKKQEKKKKSKKFKINMKKAGFIMILLFCIVLVFFGLSIVLKNINAGKKKQHLTKEIQKEKVTTQGTTHTATEEVTTETATTQEKKASTERKTEKKTESSTHKTTTDRRNITTSTRKKVGTTKKRNTTAKKKKTVKKVRKTVKTTQKKRTTTAKKRVTMQQPKTTTENSKNHTKEEFNVDYKVE